MELALAVFNIGAGIGILAVGASVAYLAWRMTPLIRETSQLADDLRRLARTTEDELRPLLSRAQELTAGVEVVSEDAAVKVARLGELIGQLEETVERRAVVAPVGSLESSQTPEERSDR